MLVQMHDALDAYLKSHQTVRARLIRTRSFLARHVLDEAMLLCVAGWSLMWADALSLVILPIWIPIACFYAGIAIIPVSRKRGMR
jgi:hypothetical protein